VEVREAIQSDARAVAAIAVESAEAHVALAPRFYRVPEMSDATRRAEAQLADPQRTTLVAVADGFVVGYVQLAPLPAPELGSMVREQPAADVSIAVSATHRGRGIGRALMEAAEDRAARDGLTLITLNALTANESAIGLYRSLGYEASGVLMHRWID
jgi:ribosomal protein S18 acetylase RimI-like enzyme